jgi:hypothetical protein
MQNEFEFLDFGHMCSSNWFRPRKWQSLKGMTGQNIVNRARTEIAEKQKKVIHAPIWTGHKR